MANEEKQIMPEVQAYLTACEEAKKAERATNTELADRYPQRLGWTEEAAEQRKAWHSAVDAAYRARQVTTNEAWNKLKSADDPLVRWIAERCKGYQDQAAQILEALPATLEELDEIAEDWCHIWTRFRDQAVEDGVIPGVKPPMPEIRAILDWVDNTSCCALTRPERRELSGKLDALVAEAKAEAVPEVAA